MALSEEFVTMLHNKGVIYLWYYIYPAIGRKSMLRFGFIVNEDILRLRTFLVEGRRKYPIVLIDSYWGADGEPFCPAAEGLSHHINPSGHIEPCPVVQFSKDRVNGQRSEGCLRKCSVFLKDFKVQISGKTKGCVLMEDPAWLQNFASGTRCHKYVQPTGFAGKT